MRRRALGASGIEVSAIGLGCWGMSGSYGPADEAESVATLHHALDLGIDFIDTADSYGETATTSRSSGGPWRVAATSSSWRPRPAGSSGPGRTARRPSASMGAPSASARPARRAWPGCGPT